MITRMHHTGVVVKNLPVMVDFYCKTLGLSIHNEMDSVAPAAGNHTGIKGARRKLVFLGLDDQPGKHLIELVHYIDPPATDGHLGKHQLGAMHICFCVNNLQEQYNRLTALGVRFETEPKFTDTPSGPLGVVYARDPEGNWLELIEGNV